MSSATGDWFLPDSEYCSHTEDDAVVGASAKLIRREIDDGNEEGLYRPKSEHCPDQSSDIRYYINLLNLHNRKPAYEFANPGTLIYADVDEDGAGHVKNLHKSTSSGERRMEGLSDEAQAAEDALVAHFIEDPDSFFDLGECEIEDAERHREVKAHCVRQWLNQKIRHSYILDQHFVNYIAGPGHKHAEELLYLVSDQDTLEHKRPAMSGWVIGYDVIKNMVTIKPFNSDKNTHPLGGAWNAFKTDGIAGRWTPREFLKQYIQLLRTLEEQIASKAIMRIEDVAEKQAGDILFNCDPSRNTFARQMLVYTMVLGLAHSIPCSVLKQETDASAKAADLIKQSKEARRKITEYLKHIPCSAPIKKFPKEASKRVRIGPFVELEWELKEMEDHFRCAAVEGQEDGREKVAQNTRAMYERIFDMVKRFNEDPEGIDIERP